MLTHGVAFGSSTLRQIHVRKMISAKLCQQGSISCLQSWRPSMQRRLTKTRTKTQSSVVTSSAWCLGWITCLQPQIVGKVVAAAVQ